MHGVFKNWHPITGMDFHIPWPPGSPSPAPAPVPYRSAFVMNGTGMFGTALLAPTTMTIFGCEMQVGTDAGTMMPHVGPPSTLLPIDIFASASKCHFGSSQYMVEGKPAAVALVGFWNPNLNCGTPAPTPTGVALSITTHFVGMTLGDLMAGLRSMAFDVCLQTALSFAGAGVGRLASGAASRLAPRLLDGPTAGLMVRMFGHPEAAGRAVERYLQTPLRMVASGLDTRAGGFAFDFFLGGPLGADAGSFGLPTITGSKPVEGLTNAIGEHFFGVPADDH